MCFSMSRMNCKLCVREVVHTLGKLVSWTCFVEVGSKVYYKPYQHLMCTSYTWAWWVSWMSELYRGCVKGRVYPGTEHEGREGEFMYSSTLSLTTVLGRGSWLVTHTGHLTCWRETWYPLFTRVNKNLSAWNFLSPKPEVTCGTVAIIIQVVLLSPYLRIHAVSLPSIHYNQSHRVYINRRRQYVCLIWN